MSMIRFFALACACLTAAPAFAQIAPSSVPSSVPSPAPTSVSPAGPHLDRDAYLERRGVTLEDGVRTSWSVETFDLDGEAIGEMRIVDLVLGDDFAAELREEGRRIYDFRLDRRLTEQATLDGAVLVNLNLAAIVHRRAQTYLSFSQGGSAEMVQFGPELSFHRFWLEAAMGVRAEPAPLTIEDSETARTVIRTPADGDAQIVFEISSERAGGSRDADTLRRWMRHALPIHPDALPAFSPGDGLPAAFSYLVISPDSPGGRREVWTRLDGNEIEPVVFWPEEIAAAGPESYGQPAALMRAGIEAASSPERGLSPDDFVGFADQASITGDRAGAYLTLYQARHHFGDCAPQAPAAYCRRATEVTAASLGDAEFERLFEALSRAGGDRAAAVEALGEWRSRRDLAGAAANLVSAMSLSALQASQRGAMAEQDPLAFFVAAIEADPYAPLTWWHTGRILAVRGRFDEAWFCFDIALSLPASGQLAILADARALEAQLHGLAPDFFGPHRTLTAPAQGPAEGPAADAAAGDAGAASEEAPPCIPGVTC